jgi:multidrug efflux system membrane fusion protein
MRLHAGQHLLKEVVRGRTEALRKVSLKVETKGRVVELPVEQGAWVAEGDVIARLSADDRPARLREAKALREQRRIEFEASQKLSKKGFRSDTQVAGSLAALEAAEAAVSLAEEVLGNTVLRAPFDGLIDDRIAEIGDFLEMGDSVAVIVNLDPILVVAQVSERSHGEVRVGQPGFARLVDGSRIDGTVRFVSAVADPATRTFRVEMAAPNPGLAVADGMTAELHLPLREIRTHRVSPAVLSLRGNGEMGVKTVDEEGRVQFLPARIVDSDSDGVWLGGLPEEVLLITVGQEFVAEGQSVRAVDAETLEPLPLAPDEGKAQGNAS